MQMRRRDFITLLGGAAATWPLAVRAQQPDRIRRIGLLNPGAEDDLNSQHDVAAFRRGLQEHGWTEGRNIHIDQHWAAANPARITTLAKEIVELRPEVILSPTTPVTAAFQQATRTIPIVFVNVSDPVGDGFVASLARPGGNMTGFINVEAAMAGKWLELLRQINPRLTRAAMMFNPDAAPGGGTYFSGPFETAASSFGLQQISAIVRSAADIEKAIAILAREPGGGLVVPPGGGFMNIHRTLIISLVAREKVPTVYAGRQFSDNGGLLSYGSDNKDLVYRSASYLDRILRGEKPADLPVQIPTKFELIINLKTAKALGLTVPPTLLAIADEVIE
jgi:putative ABC transport system substrate-binding protein